MTDYDRMTRPIRRQSTPDPSWKNGPPDEPETCAMADMVTCDGNCVKCVMNEPDYEAMAEAKGLI